MPAPAGPAFSRGKRIFAGVAGFGWVVWYSGCRLIVAGKITQIEGDEMTYREMIEALDYGVSVGRLVAVLRRDEIFYIADVKATSENHRNSLSVAEIRKLRLAGIK